MARGKDTSKDGARIVDFAAFKARYLASQRVQHPSTPEVQKRLNDALAEEHSPIENATPAQIPYDWVKEDPDLGYEGSIDSDPTPQHGTVRPPLTDKERNDD